MPNFNLENNPEGLKAFFDYASKKCNEAALLLAAMAENPDIKHAEDKRLYEKLSILAQEMNLLNARFLIASGKGGNSGYKRKNKK